MPENVIYISMTDDKVKDHKKHRITLRKISHILREGYKPYDRVRRIIT